MAKLLQFVNESEAEYNARVAKYDATREKIIFSYTIGTVSHDWHMGDKAQVRVGKSTVTATGSLMRDAVGMVKLYAAMPVADRGTIAKMFTAIAPDNLGQTAVEAAKLALAIIANKGVVDAIAIGKATPKDKPTSGFRTGGAIKL